MAGWTLWFCALMAIIGAIYWRRYQRELRAISTRRPNLTREEFMASMRVDVSDAAAKFLWETTLIYIKPHATPHPEDDLMKELPIDQDDIALDWPVDWARLNGLSEDGFPPWPEGWDCTIRNFGRWLDQIEAHCGQATRG